MAADADVDRSLAYIRQVTGQLRADLAELPTGAWDGPTNCPPWSGRQLVAHVVTGGESFRLAVERGLAGSTEPAVSEDERERRISAAAEMAPAELLERLDRATAELEGLYERLSPEQLEVICYHRRGNRPARWYIRHRLAEVAFHRWDVQRSLGNPPVLDRDVAAFLLPTLLESNLPRFYHLGPGGDGRFRLAVEGDADASWLLTAQPDRLDVERGGGVADVTITAPAETLALLVYGRANLAEEEQHGRARIDGDRALADRFHQIFRGP